MYVCCVRLFINRVMTDEATCNTIYYTVLYVLRTVNRVLMMLLICCRRWWLAMVEMAMAVVLVEATCSTIYIQ